VTVDEVTVDEVISDDELAALAMAADPDAALADDAVAWSGAAPVHELLPAWYMPPAARVGGRRRRIMVGLLVASFVAVNAAGLCVTYGFPEIAW